MQEASHIVCPHQQELFVREIQRVFYYSHEDQSDCDICNSFVMTAQEILLILGMHQKGALHGDKETIVLRTAFVCSLPFRLKFYEMLSRISDTEKLLRYLGMWERLIHAAYNEKVLNWEIVEVFKKVVFLNLSLISQTSHNAAVKAPDPLYTLPRLPMINAKNVREDAYIMDLEESVKFSKQRAARWGRKV